MQNSDEHYQACSSLSSVATNSQDYAGSGCLENSTVPKFQHHSVETHAGMTLFGLVVPLVILATITTACFATICALLFRHPIETLVQAAALLVIPLGTFLVWKDIKNKDLRKGKYLGILLGLSMGGSLLVGAVANCCILQAWTDSSKLQPFGFTVVAATAWLSFVTSVCVGYCLISQWETSGARRATLLQIGLGTVLSMLTLGATELRSALIRIQATGVIQATDDKSLQVLRALNCERDLRMDLANPRSQGITAVLWPIEPELEKNVYFYVTGKPYIDPNAPAALESLSDQALGTKIVGDILPGLSLSNSALVGRVNPSTLTASVDWTFVISNASTQPQEARAQIALPNDAVVSAMTFWMNGEEKQAAVVPAQKAEQAYRWIVVQHRDPALVTDVGKGRILMQCYPVPRQGDARINLTVKVPLRVDSDEKASLVLPRLIASNFNAADVHHHLRLRAASPLVIKAVSDSKSRVLPGGETVLTAHMSCQDLQGTGVSVSVKRADRNTPVAVVDHSLATPGYILKWHKPIDKSMAPKHLVVAIDTSVALQPYKAQLVEALSHVAKLIPTTVTLAGDIHQVPEEPLTVDDALGKIKNLQFVGGKDNTHAVVEAAQEAGAEEAGAVLWIHGPQPITAKQVPWSAPYLHRPKFFELAVDDGWTMTNNKAFAQNLMMGPANAIPRSPSLQDDLERVVSQWAPDGHEEVVKFVRTDSYDGKVISDASADDVICLWANGQIQRFLEKRNRYGASQMAYLYQLVSPVSSAVVLEHESDYRRFGLSSKPGRRNVKDEMLASGNSFGLTWAKQLQHSVETANGSVKMATAHNSGSFGSLHWARAATHSSRILGMNSAAVNFKQRVFKQRVISQYSQPRAENQFQEQRSEDDPNASTGVRSVDNFRATSTEPASADNTVGAEASSGSQTGSGTQMLVGGGAGAPLLQGATNGTIGPQEAGDAVRAQGSTGNYNNDHGHGDATFIQGVNTAASVRVDNLSSLEATVELFGKAGAVLGWVWGTVLLFVALRRKGQATSGKIDRKRLIMGITLIIMGTIVPSVLSALCSAARDANLFS